MRRLPWGPQVTSARAVIVLAPGGFLVLAHLAGGQLSLAWVLVAGLGLGCARWPDSRVPLGSWALLGLAWVIAVPAFSWLVLPAAGVGLAAHAATAYVAGAPDDAAVGPALARLWAWRLGAVFVATAGVAVVARVLSGWTIPGSRILTAVTILALAGWLVVLARERMSDS